MARITVEDCLRTVPNRFELVLLAAERARSLRLGALPLADSGREPPPLLALREIAAGRASPVQLRDLARHRRAFLAVPATGCDEMLPRRTPFRDEEPDLRYEADGEGYDEIADEDDHEVLLRPLDEGVEGAR